MAGFKRGGFRGGGGGTFKKGNAKKRVGSEDEEMSTRNTKKSKTDAEDDEPATAVPKLETDDEGRKYIALNASGKRRVIVDEFRDNPLINVREFWTNEEGEFKPGKKGISLTIDQYNMLLAAAPLIEAELTKKNVQVVRPEYDADVSAANASKVADTGGNGDVEEAEVLKDDNDEE
ncbi:transcriptional Coactivator p15-domain-containing protein [Phaeosphaeriaceae sp. PMI808]|nr:transcriptional Coactivator p15-domain-containing protein [Phaeosphaeriaceae sp. PMI808]